MAALIAALAIGAFGLVLALTAGDDDAADRAAPASTVSPSALVPTPPATPLGIAARTQPFAVDLRWRPDASEGAIAGYTVYRNGTEIGTVTGGGPGRFTDDDVVPLVRYVYAVAAVGEDDLASEPVELRVKTPAAPLSDARLEGTFDVRIEQVSTFGYTSSGGDRAGGWSFSPRCERGACDVKVARVFRGAASVSMDRSSASYRAQGSGKLGVRCGGTPSTSTYVIRLKVTRAETVDGVWHAVALEGTFVHREAAQLGCVAGGANLRLTGRLVDL